VEYAAAVLLLLALVALVVVRPLLSRGEPERRDEGRREELEAAKEAKYREIRDAELDFGMGKLSEAEWRASDRELRAQAIEILRQLDRAGGGEAGEQPLP
jgi:membrane protein implicated in regulation of membrane protease activity